MSESLFNFKTYVVIFLREILLNLCTSLDFLSTQPVIEKFYFYSCPHDFCQFYANSHPGGKVINIYTLLVNKSYKSSFYSICFSKYLSTELIFTVSFKILSTKLIRPVDKFLTPFELNYAQLNNSVENYFDTC